MNDSQFADRGEPITLVYCTYCHKTHGVVATETPCAPGAWLDPASVSRG